MSLLRIVTVRDDDAAVLRAKAREVRRIDRDLRRLMEDMVETMRDAPGVGLAAPQVGLDVRVIVVEVPVDEEDAEAGTRVTRIADPEIVWASEEVVEDQEACLSIPGLFGDVPRHAAIRVRGIDGSGRRVELEVEGFEARVFQHEIDHLDGILFPDRVSGFEKLYTLRETDEGEVLRVPYEPDTA